MLIRAECPRTSDPNAKRFCPAWHPGIVWKNDATGEEQVVNCSMRAIMPGMVQVIAASNRPAKAIESVRNELAEKLTGIGAIITAGMAAALEEPIPAKQIEDHNGHE